VRIFVESIIFIWGGNSVFPYGDLEMNY